jgi:hypothetical protein
MSPTATNAPGFSPHSLEAMARARTLPIVSAAFLLMAQAAFATPAAADDTVRCGNKLISEGMMQNEVRAACGEPKAATVETVPVYVKNRNGAVQQTGTTVVEYWTYDRGPTQFPARLRFEGGKLTSLELVRPGDAREDVHSSASPYLRTQGERACPSLHTCHPGTA